MSVIHAWEMSKAGRPKAQDSLTNTPLGGDKQAVVDGDLLTQTAQPATHAHGP